MKNKLPKGWIVLDVLCYESDADKELSKILDKERSLVFRPIALQVSKIVGVDLEYADDFLEEGANANVHTVTVQMETKQTPEEVFELIKLDEKK